MSEISAKMIQELRERSGVGMSKCKEALVEADGNMDKAIEILRKAGLASSVKKEGRETKEGIAFAYQTKDILAIIEVNSETDFVAKNEKFKLFVENICKQAAETTPKSLDVFLTEKYKKDPGLTIDGYRNLMIQSLGENIQVRRLEIFHKDKNASYGIYSHMGGKILSIVEIKGADTETTLAYDVAMHVAAEDPTYLKPEEIPAEVRKKEEEIARSQIKGKPENVIGKILEGKLKAFADQVCLIHQKYVKDNTVSVEQYVTNQGKNLQVTCFWRWKVGE
ncbi:MAG: elongation factor Ts [Chlamydiae bacterium]|nr:elongation factor Ts [Chlamydiota bacterium]